MNRLIYYLIFINMFSNIATIVPRVLLANSKDGALVSMGLGLIAGLVLTYVIIRFFNKYPGKDFPELMKCYTSKWFHLPTLFIFAIMWYLAGLITIGTYSFILLTFLTPEMALATTILPFLIVLSFGIIIKTKNVLNAMEIVTILFLPIGFFVFLKSYMSKQLNWDLIKLAVMNANDMPNLSSFSASLFLFMGVINITIFNRYFLKKQIIGIKQLTIIGLMGCFVLITTYFLPIGFGGFDEIDKLLYPWISTTDSVRMRFGIIERLVFVFLVFFLSISFVSVLIHWHVSVQFLISIIPLQRLKWKSTNLALTFYALVLSISALFIIIDLTAAELYEYTRYFYNTSLILIAVLFISMAAVNRGAKK